MTKMNFHRPYGKVSPPLEIPGCPMPAHYEQDGVLYDAHGSPCQPEVANAAPAAKAPATEELLPLSALLAQADTLPYQRLLRSAKAILGEQCPNGKKAIVEALLAAKDAYEARKAKTGAPVAPAAPTPPEQPAVIVPPTPPAPPAAAKPAGNGVDLAAWGRGQKDYLFGEIRKAVRETYHCQLSERRDVIELLIKERVITAQEARKDV